MSAVMLPPPYGLWGMPKEVLETLPGFGSDVAKNRAEARQIMEKLGYSKDKPLKIKVATRNIAIYRDPAVILIDQLKSIYIDAELDPIDTTVWYNKIQRKDYSVGLNLIGGGVDDPDTAFYENFHSASDRNYTAYKNPEIDALIDKQSAELDRDKRKKIVEIEKKLAEDGARPVINHNVANTCWTPQMKGLVLQHNGIYNGWRFEDIWLDRYIARRRPLRPLHTPPSRRGRLGEGAAHGSNSGETDGLLSRPTLPADGAHPVRDVHPDLRDAALGAGRHRRHPGRCRGHRRSQGEGQDRQGAGARPADHRAVRPDRRADARRSRLRLRLGAAGDEEIAPRIPISAKLTLMALFFSVILGVPFGVISAVRQNTTLDYSLRVLSLSGLSLPSFWLGLLVLMASVHWFGTIPIYTNEPRGFLQRSAWAIPAAVVGFQVRADHAAHALVHAGSHAPGLHPNGALKGRLEHGGELQPRAAQCALPVVTIIGIEAAFLVGGLIVTETVFNIPGVARFLVEAIRWRDYPDRAEPRDADRLRGGYGPFLVDMAYMVLDLRIKYAD